MRWLYSLALRVSTLLIKSAAPFYKKAKLWSIGRKKILLFLEEKCQNKKNIIWFHCASLGEFEQGKPLMQKIKQDKNVTLLVTFFSPSGFEVKKNDPIADIVAYLPVDTPQNAKKFINIVKPQKAFFVKYEFWYNYLIELSKANIPVYYVSAIFRENQYFFKSYGKWFLKQLKTCKYFFVQNENSKNILLKHGIQNVKVTGDTRFDRVFEIAQQPYTLDFITSFKQDKKMLVAGSTWLPDEKLLSELFSKINAKYKLVIAPHEVTPNHIEKIKNIFKTFSVVCYSEKEKKDLLIYDVLILDTIGLLSKTYKYADISYIGGAFKTGLHNILEAAVFEKPIFFGPHYQKFNEAIALVSHGAAFPVSCASEMNKKIMDFENDSNYYTYTCEVCKNYTTQNLGATKKILNCIYSK